MVDKKKPKNPNATNKATRLNPMTTKGIRARPYADPEYARQRAHFIENLKTGMSVASAITKASDMSSRTFYSWKHEHPEFREAWEEALDIGTGVFADEAKRRGVDGWEEPVFQGGELVGHVRKYSDKLLEMMLIGRDPSFRRNAPAQPVFLQQNNFDANAMHGMDPKEAMELFQAALRGETPPPKVIDNE